MADFVNDETVKKWQTRVGRAPAHVQEAVNRIGTALYLLSLKHMDQEIYSIPEDVSPKTGKKKWQRTGRLFQGEKLEFAPDHSGVTLTNTVEYAHARHELGRDGRQTKRPAHWRDSLFRELEPVIAAEMQAMTRRILEGRE